VVGKDSEGKEPSKGSDVQNVFLRLKREKEKLLSWVFSGSRKQRVRGSEGRMKSTGNWGEF